MINPTQLQQLTRQRQREVVTARVRQADPFRQSVRERLGWSLVGLGARLALNSAQRGLAEERLGGLAPFARP
ncbi:MAG: hypothetical protein ABSG36_15080 [Acidimicrobiales bacterium]|jgi:hypothetical protein